ncbi:hypothetical protein C8J56DRAFT_1031896 [Mycena floridula]|nr:hypothetical protein C8J56DRAFT_1031896 [Mycena floridula]
MPSHLTSFSVVLLVLHRALAAIVRRDNSTGTIFPECQPRCAVFTNFAAKFPPGDGCPTGNSACETYICTEPNVHLMADCYGCEVAYDPTGTLTTASVQDTLDKFVAGCISNGFSAMGKVTIIPTKNPVTTSKDPVITSAANDNPSSASGNPGSLQTDDGSNGSTDINPTPSQSPTSTPQTASTAENSSTAQSGTPTDSGTPDTPKNAGSSLGAVGTLAIGISLVTGALLA